jgi:hypothetical protein
MSLLGTVSIGGTMTIEDFTNIDSVGLITARSGIHVTGGDFGVGTNNPTFSNGSGLEVARDGISCIRIEGNNQNHALEAYASSDGATLDARGSNAKLMFDIGGSEKLRITSTGNVGINDTNPTAKLSVIGNLYVSADSFTGENSGIFFSGWNDYGAGVYGRNSGNDLVMNAGSSEKVRITSDGKVAIGFNAPAVAGLSIANSSTSLGFEFDTASGFAGGPTIRGYHRPSTAYKSLGITGADIKFGINDVEKLRLDSNGYLGLNNSAPHNQYYNNLVIGDGSASGDKGITIRTQSSNEGVIAFSDADSGAARYAGKIAYNHGTNAMMFFTTNGDERLRITDAGDVLIADTTNAIYDDSTGGGMNLKANGQLVLKKQATSTADPLMWLNDTGQTTNKFILFAQDGNEKASIGLAGNDLRFARDGYNETLRITSDGMVGINMTPSTVGSSTYMLQMYNPGSQCFMSLGEGSGGNGPLNGLVIGVSNAAHYITGRENRPMIFATNDTERLRIHHGGQVTMPEQPAWNLRPNASSTLSTSSGSNIIGWSANTSGSSSTTCFLRGGVTLSGSSGSTSHNGSSSGRINVPVAGTYKVWCTIRCENTPGAGNIYLRVNGTTVARQHVEVWGRYNFAHGFHSHILNLTANSYIEWVVTINAGTHNISGYNDTVNWTGGHLIG